MKRHRETCLCLLWSLFLLLPLGCGKKEPAVISLYCSGSHLPAAEKLASTFQSVYGVAVVCIPTDAAIHSIDTQFDEKERDPFKKKRNEMLESKTFTQLRDWVEYAVYKDFCQYLLDNRSGDIYLCDSTAELERLTEGDLILKSRAIAYLTPVLIVQPEQAETLRSVEDVLKSTFTLGVVHKEVGGLGKMTEQFLGNLRQKDSALENAGRIETFDNETLLAQAWKEKRIAAAICWDSTATKSFPQTEPIALPRADVLATPLSLCDLAGGADYQIMEQLAIFALSEKGQAIFTQFGYKTK